MSPVKHTHRNGTHAHQSATCLGLAVSMALFCKAQAPSHSASTRAQLTLSHSPRCCGEELVGCLLSWLVVRSGAGAWRRLRSLDREDQDLDTPKPVSFTVKETVCLRTTQQPPEQCDFKENGLVKQCVGTVTLDQSKDQFDIKCNELQSVRRIRFRPPYLPRPGRRPRFPPPFPIPRIPRIP
uniref:Antibacterial protein PR-39-like isoform X1 n=1 Tax=Tursiops truncatus TaxID=9739 RepID=A0A6J3QVW5_TURTR|nr:antibacterial protein PR-39-like isoform X2 [Tursiops truncatus]XP_033706315.1 antibacterial protein PR-39-like isoform X2 [Tursiops truncatus]XP_033720748.1 antibacterial protein PR-39-like isoform X1 [Tursiops truncatus]